MSTLFFPSDSYKKYVGAAVEEFSFTAMILVAFSRYCWQLILAEIFNIPFSYKQNYEYRFNTKEIASLAKYSENYFKKKYSYCVDFDFSLALVNKRYAGIVKIDAQFVNNNTLENSYYSISIEMEPKFDMKIYPFFLTERGFNMHICEFIQKLWQPIFMCLESLEVPSSVRLHNYKLSKALIIEDERLERIQNNRDFIKDVLFIVAAIIEKYQTDYRYVQISADDVLFLRGLEQNRNAKGVKSGYKRKERYKVHYALQVLNLLGLLLVREVSTYNYIIKPKVKPTNILPLKACKYCYKTNLWEKRLAVSLHVNKSKLVKVGFLYTQFKDVSTSLKPLQIRDRFEEAMDNLVADKIIEEWHYSKINEAEMGGKQWFSRWLELKVSCRYCH